MCKSFSTEYACRHRARTRTEPCSKANNGFDNCAEKRSVVVRNPKKCAGCLKTTVDGWAKAASQAQQKAGPTLDLPFESLQSQAVSRPKAVAAPVQGSKRTEAKNSGGIRKVVTKRSSQIEERSTATSKKATRAQYLASSPSNSTSSLEIVKKANVQTKLVGKDGEGPKKRPPAQDRVIDLDGESALSNLPKRAKTKTQGLSHNARKSKPKHLKLKQETVIRSAVSPKTPKTTTMERLQRVIERLERQIRKLGYSPAWSSVQLSPAIALLPPSLFSETSTRAVDPMPRRSPRLVQSPQGVPSPRPLLQMPDAATGTPHIKYMSRKVTNAVAEVANAISRIPDGEFEITDDDVRAFESALLAAQDSESEESEEE